MQKRKKKGEIVVPVELNDDLAWQLEKCAQTQGLKLEELLARFIEDGLRKELEKKVKSS